MKTAMLIIDPQNDFCTPSGALYVPGAKEDCIRLSAFIKKHKSKIEQLYITLDSHPYYHIAHPSFWLDNTGKNPAPFTVIKPEDIETELYKPVKKELIPRIEAYLHELETKGRYCLTLWPPHCLFATDGFCIEKNILEALREWEIANPCKNIEYIQKAANPLTEHYSAIQAEVPDPADEKTRTNFEIIENLKKVDKIIIAGEALSHCVANTVKDLAVYIKPEKFILLRDCTSSVGGFNELGEEFMRDMLKRGMKTINSCDLQFS